MSKADPTTGEQLDEVAIRDLLSRAFNAIDLGDAESKGLFFAVDARQVHADSALGEVVGLEALGRMAERIAANFRTTHSIANQAIDVTGDTARAVTHAIAYVVVLRDERMLVRGLRYVDELRRTADGWRISVRSHEVLWQFEADSLEPKPLSEYMSAG